MFTYQTLYVGMAPTHYAHFLLESGSEFPNAAVTSHFRHTHTPRVLLYPLIPLQYTATMTYGYWPSHTFVHLLLFQWTTDYDLQPAIYHKDELYIIHVCMQTRDNCIQQ